MVVTVTIAEKRSPILSNIMQILSDRIQRTIESASSIHVLAIFPFLVDCSVVDVVSLNVFSLGSIESAESHERHHRRIRAASFAFALDSFLLHFFRRAFLVVSWFGF